MAVYGALSSNKEANGPQEIAPRTSYDIDSHPMPSVFAPSLTDVSQRQILFFRNDTLTPTNHTLVITSLQPGATFFLDSIEFTSLEADQNNSKNEHSSHNSHHSSINMGAIVGAVIGTLALILLATCAFLALRYYRKRTNNFIPETPVYRKSLSFIFFKIVIV